MKSLIIIPTYNEKENIRRLIHAIQSENLQQPLDILVVDSASPDRTADAVLEMQGTDPSLFLIRQSAKLGLGKAYLEGMEWALSRNYDFLITMDADFSHHPSSLRRLIQEMKSSDLAIGSRYVPGGGLKNWSATRRLLSRFANKIARKLTGLPFHDLTSGFHCFRTSLLKRILRHHIRSEGYAFQMELKFLAIREGARHLEIPIVFSDRTEGRSKISRKVILEAIFFILRCSMQRIRIPGKYPT